MSPPSLKETLTSERLFSLDGAKLASYNSRVSPKFQLRPELGPSAYEGDIDFAPVILLLANPGFDDEDSTLDDHRFQRDGWPLSGLHPDAPPGLRSWWRGRLNHLIVQFGAQRVSQCVACIQITPWASPKFDDGLCLPSRDLLLDAANQCAARGAVMLVMRAERLWLQAEALRTTPLRFRVNSWLSSYVSPGNLPEIAWRRVVEAVRDA